MDGVYLYNVLNNFDIRGSLKGYMVNNRIQFRRGIKKE